MEAVFQDGTLEWAWNKEGGSRVDGSKTVLTVIKAMKRVPEVTARDLPGSPCASVPKGTPTLLNTVITDHSNGLTCQI